MESIGIRRMMVAGLAGGAVELAWVAGWRAATGQSVGEVARQITASVLPGAGGAAAAGWLGVGIHFALAMAVGIAFGVAVWRPFAQRRGRAVGVALGVATLAAIWAVDFLAVLPQINPAFVALMPSAVTLAGKVLFGATLAWVLQRAGRDADAHAGFVLVGLARATRLANPSAEWRTVR